MITDGSNITITPLNQETLPAAPNPYHVSRSNDQPSVLLGGATPKLLNGAGSDDGTNRIEVTVSKPIIFQMAPSNRYYNHTQIQVNGTVAVQVSISDPSLIAEDATTVASGGSPSVALWTTLTLTNGLALLDGTINGVYFTGAGRATVVKQ